MKYKKNSLWLVFFLLLSLFLSSCQNHGEKPIAVVEVETDNNFLVEICSEYINPFTKERTFCFGSAFFVEYNGKYFLISAAHIIEKCSSISVKYGNKYLKKDFFPFILGTHDIFVCPIKAKPNNIKILKLSKSIPKKKEALVSHGIILGKKVEIKCKYLSADLVPVNLNLVPFYSVSGKTIKGMSGGPVLDNNGYVVGINSMFCDIPGKEESYFVPSVYVICFLESICK